MRSGAILLRVILSLLMGIGFSACPKPGGATVAAGGDVDYYTCTMHPWVHSKKPGTCPVCAMDLVPVYKKKSQDEQASQTPGTNPRPTRQPELHDFDVPVERQQQFGVTYAQTKRQRLVRTIRTVG